MHHLKLALRQFLTRPGLWAVIATHKYLLAGQRPLERA